MTGFQEGGWSKCRGSPCILPFELAARVGLSFVVCFQPLFTGLPLAIPAARHDGLEWTACGSALLYLCILLWMPTYAAPRYSGFGEDSALR